VAAVEGTVAVSGRTGLIGPGVEVGAGQTSRVELGKFPSPAREMTAADHAQLMQASACSAPVGAMGWRTTTPCSTGAPSPESDRPQITAAAGRGGQHVPESAGPG
jgi:hypothetical protein